MWFFCQTLLAPIMLRRCKNDPLPINPQSKLQENKNNIQQSEQTWYAYLSDQLHDIA